jgi:hypothetical protein
MEDRDAFRKHATGEGDVSLHLLPAGRAEIPIIAKKVARVLSTESPGFIPLTY